MVFTYFWYYTVGEWTSSRFSAAVSDFSCESDSESWEALLYTDVSSQTAALMLLLLLLLLFSYRSQFYWDRLRQQNRFALPHLSFSESVSLDHILTKTETKYFFDSIVLDSNSLSFLINCLLITELIAQLPKFLLLTFLQHFDSVLKFSAVYKRFCQDPQLSLRQLIVSCKSCAGQ